MCYSQYTWIVKADREPEANENQNPLNPPEMRVISVDDSVDCSPEDGYEASNESSEYSRESGEISSDESVEWDTDDEELVIINAQMQRTDPFDEKSP